LGCEIPIGGQRRGVWYAQLAEEMDIQGWDWNDLVNAVDYLVETGKTVRTVNGVLFFVDEAKRMRATTSTTDLQVKVAEALATETDEYWRRRLSLAQGKNLERVYEEWTGKNEQ
jgi:hypothetical protein